MNMKSVALAVGLAVGSIGMVGVAQAAPMLSIVLGQGAAREVVGDAGGTTYPWPANTAGVGAGVPSAAAGWPNNGGGGYPPGFAPDPSFPPGGGGALGTSGWDASYLWLSESANVTFQFMGGGDSSLLNHFFVNGVEMFQDSHGSNPTNPIAVAGDPPVYNGVIGTFPDATLIPNQYTVFIPVAAGGGYVPFYFVTGNGVTSANDGINNLPDNSLQPGFMLGADPYLAPGPFSCSNEPGNPLNGTCSAVFAGLADLPRLNGALDHDYQDMGVRISVPEPGSLFLLGAGLIGLAGLRRRKA